MAVKLTSLGGLEEWAAGTISMGIFTVVVQVIIGTLAKELGVSFQELCDDLTSEEIISIILSSSDESDLSNFKNITHALGAIDIIKQLNDIKDILHGC